AQFGKSGECNGRHDLPRHAGSARAMKNIIPIAVELGGIDMAVAVDQRNHGAIVANAHRGKECGPANSTGPRISHRVGGRSLDAKKPDECQCELTVGLKSVIVTESSMMSMLRKPCDTDHEIFSKNSGPNVRLMRLRSSESNMSLALPAVSLKVGTIIGYSVSSPG